MSFERDQDEREDEEIRKAFAEKDAQIEQLQARSCRDISYSHKDKRWCDDLHTPSNQGSDQIVRASSVVDGDAFGKIEVNLEAD